VVTEGTLNNHLADTEGVQQGNSGSEIAFCASVKDALDAASAVITQYDGIVLAQIDDIYICGPLDKLTEAAEAAIAELEKIGLQINPDKTTIYSPTNNPLDIPPTYRSKRGSVKINNVDYFGITINGIPIGEEEYINQILSEKTDEVLSNLTTLTTELTSKFPYELWSILHFCYKNQYNHWLQQNTPHHTIPQVMKINHHIKQTIASLSDSPEFLSTDQENEILQQRLALPIRLGGLGLPSPIHIAHAAYVAGIQLVAPSMINQKHHNGFITPGLATALTDLFGENAFDTANNGKGSYQGFKDSQIPTSATYIASYNHLINHTEYADGTRADGPIIPEIADAGNAIDKQQRQICAQINLVLDARFKTLIKNTPKENFQRISFFSTWDNLTARLFLTTNNGNSQYSHFSPLQFQETFTRYFGLPSIICRKYVGQLVKKVPLSPHGLGLLNASLKGSPPTVKHDAIKHIIASCIEACGVNCTMEVYNLFAEYIGAQAREAHSNSQNPYRARQAIVPDFLVDLIKQLLAELKVITYGVTNYHPANVHKDKKQYAVEKKALDVETMYPRKARDIDRRFNNTPPGTKGPVEMKLDSYGEVVPLIAGHFGEINRKFTQLLLKLAKHAAQTLYKDMLLGTEEQAASIIMWQLQGRIGAAIQTENARFLENRITYMAKGFTQAHQRRQRARVRFYGRTQDPTVLVDQYRDHQRSHFGGF